MEHQHNAAGHLVLGGADAIELASTYSTPLIVYDVADIRRRARAFRDAFAAHEVQFQVAYASKALSILAMYQVALQEGLSIDVVSGGELYTALAAGVPASRIHFHGNNKSEAEVRYAMTVGIGCFVVDSQREVAMLQRVASELSNNATASSPALTPPSTDDGGELEQPSVKVLLRVAPGVTAHTHEYNTTGQVDSKFGLDIASGQATQAYKELSSHPRLQVMGLHCHIGSQIFNAGGHVSAALRLMDLMSSWGMTDCTLNVGGGYGVRYTPDDHPLPLAAYVDAIVGAVKDYVAQSASGIKVPSFWIEPGRSLISEAGTTLYTVGSEKVVPGVRRYLAVDGGMSDNMRPVTYQAVYSAAVADRITEPATETYNIVGKLCESGDQLIRDAVIQKAKEGDILAVFCTGAYCYSMASNYNKMCRPAVVFVEDGVASLVVRRETPEDLIRTELLLPSSTSTAPC